MSDEELLEKAEGYLRKTHEVDSDPAKIQSLAQASMAASLLVIARNSAMEITQFEYPTPEIRKRMAEEEL